jgi:DNA transformation protein and related proteins
VTKFPADCFCQQQNLESLSGWVSLDRPICLAAVKEHSEMQTNDKLLALRNIGPKLASMLAELGIRDRASLQKAGSANLYKKLQAFSERRLPVCYYLYSLEGAIKGIHWNELSEREKRVLRQKAGLK